MYDKIATREGHRETFSKVILTKPWLRGQTERTTEAVFSYGMGIVKPFSGVIFDKNIRHAQRLKKKTPDPVGFFT